MIGGVGAGPEYPARIMGIINLSPESFHGISVRESHDAVAGAAVRMAENGADYIDVGGMSTAPYLKTWVSEETERERVVAGVRAVAGSCDIPISVDTCRSGVAAAAMDAGATILNDVTGLRHDPGMKSVVSKYGSVAGSVRPGSGGSYRGRERHRRHTGRGGAEGPGVRGDS